MEAVSSHPQVHPRLVFLSGFSAGAYAITELLAVGIPFPVASIVFGGVHGHGNATEVCNSLALSNAVRVRTPEFDGKWRAYMSRLSQPSEDDIRSIVVVHNKRDLMSPWVAAEPIIHAIDQSRAWNDLDLVRQVVFIQEKSNKNKNAHQYWRRVHEELFEEILLARSVLITQAMAEPKEKAIRPKKSKKQPKMVSTQEEVPSSSSMLCSCSSSSSSSFMAASLAHQVHEASQMIPQLPVVLEGPGERRSVIVTEVEVAPQRQRERYEKPTEEILEALRHALFSSLPPEDYLQRKAAAEKKLLDTSCPIEPLKDFAQKPDSLPNWSGILGLFGTIQPITLLLPPEEDLAVADLTGDLPPDGLWKVIAKEAVLRTSASTSSPKIGKVPQGTIVRVIGNPRYFQGILRARAEILSEDLIMCGQIGYLTLNGLKVGGPVICDTEGPGAMDDIRVQPFLKRWQEGLGPCVDDDDIDDDSPTMTHAEVCFERDNLAKLRSMLAAALPLKEHFIALRREEDLRVLPMNKHDKVDYEIPLATCLRVPPWSYVLSLGADSDELVPSDTRHLGGALSSSSSSSSLWSCSSCSPFWSEDKQSWLFVLRHLGGGNGVDSFCRQRGSSFASASSCGSTLAPIAEEDPVELPDGAIPGAKDEAAGEDDRVISLLCTHTTKWRKIEFIMEQGGSSSLLSSLPTTKKKIALPRVELKIAEVEVWDFDLIFFCSPSSQIFYEVLPPLPDRKKRKRREEDLD
eukprot:4003806-Amphidinium_carterae.1